MTESIAELIERVEKRRGEIDRADWGSTKRRANRYLWLEECAQSSDRIIAAYREAMDVVGFYAQGGNDKRDRWEHPELGSFIGKRARALIEKHGRKRSKANGKPRNPARKPGSA